MASKSSRLGMLVLVGVLLVAIVLLQIKIDPMRHEFEPKNANGVSTAEDQLPVEFALGAALGFREAIAGLLWVRTDEFFDDGDYDAIVPMVRIITWLDPHNTDVYETGAWHMDYNFTDASQRSDRRYIPLAVALLEEGIANNPTNSTMYADLAFTHFYRKIEDYPRAVEWFEKGQALKSSEPNTWDVTSVGHGLAHAYLACGEIDKAIAEWKLVVAEHKRRMDANPKDVIDSAGYNVSVKNLYETEMRKKWRATMTKPPVNVKFDATMTRIAPMVFTVNGHASFIGSTSFVLASGKHTWGPADGTRIEVRLQDASYKYPPNQVFTLASGAAKDVTIMQDAISVNKGVFTKKIDMSQDHSGDDPMYSFTAPKYTVTFWFNPGCEMDNPPFVADRIGWAGEGLAQQQYLDTSDALPGTNDSHVQGFRMLKKTIVLTRADIMGQGIQEFH